MQEHTFRIALIGFLQILDNTVLSNELFNLALRINIKRVFVEQGNLVLALALSVISLALSHGEGVSPTGWVVKSCRKLGIALTKVVLGLGVHKELLSHALGVWLAWPLGRCWLLAGSLGPANQHSQHLTIPYSGIF